MGWTDFSDTVFSKYATFTVRFSSLSSPAPGTNITYGATMQPPVPIGSPTNQPMQTIGISLFYMQAMICTNASYFFDAPNHICI